MDEYEGRDTQTIPLDPDAIRENVKDQYLMELERARTALRRAYAWGREMRVTPEDHLVEIDRVGHVLADFAGWHSEAVALSPTRSEQEIRSAR